MAGRETAGAKEEETEQVIYVGFAGKGKDGCRSHGQAHVEESRCSGQHVAHVHM